MTDSHLRPVSPTPQALAALRPLALEAVRLDSGGLLGAWQARNAAATIPHCIQQLQECGALSNMRQDQPYAGMLFADSDIYKTLEAVAWADSFAGQRDFFDTTTAQLAKAQGDDGYLNSYFTAVKPQERWQDLRWGHELYCAGHLIQAAVAAPDTQLMAVARRFADHIVERFSAVDGVCGHPEIETALVELYRATGEARYLEQARLFVERRGRPALADVELGRAYFQDDMPVRAARVFRGHAVRALYLAAGVVDVAVETGDHELLATVEDQWARTVATRTYLTGGMGSRHRDEAFGDDYELPPDRAYAETCAGVASVQLAWRLLLATGKAQYADLMERTLYNVVAAAMAQDGRAFFYTNPLHVRSAPAPSDPTVESPRAQAGVRAAWFTTACCPPNVARLLAALSGYAATTDGAGVQLHQLVPGVVEAPLAAAGVGTGGAAVRLRVETEYPWSGRVTVHVEAVPAVEARWSLAVRIPPWAGHPTASVYSASRSGETWRTQNERYAAAERVWRVGDELRLELPLRPRWTYPDPRVDAIRGTVAVERGPLVYCAESPVAPGAGSLEAVTVDDTGEPADVGPEPALGGAVTVGVIVTDPQVPTDPGWAYGPDPAPGDPGPPRTLALVPYYARANGGPATMRVWLPLGAWVSTDPRS